MSPLEIRSELLRAGYSNRRIASRLSLSDRTVHNVIYRHGKSRRVAAEIAQLIGKPMTKVWGREYESSQRGAR